MNDETDGCVEPVRGPISKAEAAPAPRSAAAKEVHMSARVGHAAPDFEASGLVNGKFGTVKLSDYLGKWVVLCFYPGDFTFV